MSDECVGQNLECKSNRPPSRVYMTTIICIMYSREGGALFLSCVPRMRDGFGFDGACEMTTARLVCVVGHSYMRWVVVCWG